MKKVLPVFISVIVLVLNILCADASENTLRAIDIKSGENSYTIELTADKPSKVSKTIISTNRILLTLDNIKSSNNISTHYDNNAVIDNVIVEPQGTNSISIMLQGDNIAYSDVNFKSPTSIQQIQDNVVDSISSVASFGTPIGQNKTLPCAILVIFIGILAYEIKLIKSKYNELNNEKQLLEKDIERTSEFKDYMKGYGNMGIKKPYTTPIYSNPKNSSDVRTNYLQKLQSLQTPETITLNSLLNNNNQEIKIINKVVNPKMKKHVFGSLSNMVLNKSETIKETNTTTNPLQHANLNSQLAHLETLSKLYQQSNEENKESLAKRLNGLY